jgi:ADP-ribose pyrophosphatase YjhB (NUDIX family)
LNPKWLTWVLRIQAISQTGLHYCIDQYDIERYQELRHISEEMIAHYSGTELEYIKDLDFYESGHITPKFDVRGVVFHDDAFLLVQERSTSKWTLPGGFADVGQSAAEAAVREVREESGYEVQAQRLLALWDRAKHHQRPVPFYCYRAYFECLIVGGEPTVSIESADVRFFRLSELPELDPGRVTADQLERLWHLHQHAEIGAEFD